MTYNVTFYAHAGYAYDDKSADPNAFLTASIDSDSPPGQTLTESGSTTSWAPYTFSFTGTGSDTLTFAAQTNPSEWYVDDVIVLGQSSPSPIPESASFLLMGTGLLGIAGILRRKWLA